MNPSGVNACLAYTTVLLAACFAGMGDHIPVAVRMRVECARFGHIEDESYAFDMPIAKAQPMEEYEPGTCSECGAPIRMHLKRTQRCSQNVTLVLGLHTRQVLNILASAESGQR